MPGMKTGIIAPVKITRRPEAAAKAKPNRKFTLSKVHQEKGQSAPFAFKALIFGGCLLAVFIIAVCLANGRSRGQDSRRTSTSAGGRNDNPQNMSIAEWMKKNNVETDMEKQRKAGARRFDR